MPPLGVAISGSESGRLNGELFRFLDLRRWNCPVASSESTCWSSIGEPSTSARFTRPADLFSRSDSKKVGDLPRHNCLSPGAGSLSASAQRALLSPR